MLPTIAEVLALPSVQAGKPVVVAGAHQLGRRVRWVHVAPPSGGQRLLLGGELLLATGVGWPAQPPELHRYVAELSSAQVAGLVLELGSRYQEPPDVLVSACEELELPLVVLNREVRFVSITQAVHSRIIDSQTGALRERDRIHAVFAELNRRGCSTTFLLDEAARMLHRPVVLEDLNHRVVAWAALDREPATLLAGWATQSRRAAQDSVDCPPPHERIKHWSESGWLRTVVEAQGQRWGTLVALECLEVPDTAGVVLDSAAQALSLGRVSGAAVDEWATLGQRRLLENLLTGSYVALTDLQMAFEASGMRVAGRELVAVARRTRRGQVADHLRQVRLAAEQLDFDVLCSPWSEEPQTTALFVLSFGRGRQDVDDAIVALLAGSGDKSPAVVAVGAVARSFEELLQSADEAISLLQSTPQRSPEGTVIHRSRTGALDVLLNRKRHDPDLQAFVERVVGPLLAHDAKHRTDLITVARACAQHPTNRKRAAATCHLSRSVFYQRMQLIEQLLEVDLNDGRTIAAIHVALVAFGQRLTAESAPPS